MNTSLGDQDTPYIQNTAEPSLSKANLLQESKHDKQIPVLDGIRAIACLGVLLFHMSLIAGTMGIWGPVYDIHDLSGIFAYFASSLAYFG